MSVNAITVRQLNCYVKKMLEADAHLTDVTVVGEISNYKNHYASGHWYFTLKDGDAAVRCIMYRSNASRVPFAVRDGMEVTVRGRVSLYEKDGQYQLYAEDMAAGGIGELAVQFELIRQRLEADGLFSPDSKRPLIPFPRRIAVITSDTGAAVQDIINITARRDPLCEILLCPVAVQGDNAVPEMVDALERVYQLGTADMIIIGRGGGSAEDLQAFNSEILARKIYESPIPVISAVGHETDTTICDFVADYRAPTPSAAAEIAVPDIADLSLRLQEIRRILKVRLSQQYQSAADRLQTIRSAGIFAHPQEIVLRRGQDLDRSQEKLIHLGSVLLDRRFSALSNAVAKLDALSPLKVMSRGFSAVSEKGVPIHSVSELAVGQSIRLRFSDGHADCSVKGVEYGDES